MPRLIGPELALDYILSGKQIDAPRGLKLGLINSVVGENSLRADGVAFAKNVVKESRPLLRVRDREDKITEFRGKNDIFDAVRKRNAKKFRGFKAPEKIIQSVQNAVEAPFEEVLKSERAFIEELVTSPESAAQRYVFFAERATAKIPGMPKDMPIRAINSVAVIGAGTMGGGIAMNFLNIGIPVTLLEQNGEAFERGLSVIRKNYQNSVKRGRTTDGDLVERMDLITPSTDYSAINNADLIIEAVYESMEVKKEVFGSIDNFAKQGAILASNPSYLDLNEIAGSTSRPQDVVGLHFFSPANIMPLLEVVRGAQTSEDIVNTSMRLAKKIGKTPVLAGVCEGFIANRIMRKRRVQADDMMLQGVSPAEIDRVIYEYGFAMGPFQMADLVGLDVIGRNSKEKTVQSELVARDRLGQKKNGGFYDYDENRKATLSPVALEVIKEVAEEKGIAPITADADEILERLLLPIVNEGAKLITEGIALRASDVDIACIKGYNWPVYRGGPMFWADQIGLNRVVKRLREFEGRFGNEFTPAALLVECAEKGMRLSEATST